MGPFILAWLVGEGIISYRAVKKQKAPPGPGQLLFSSGVFVLLAIMAEFPSARKLAITLAWGFDIGAFMNLWGTGASIVGGQTGNAINGVTGTKAKVLWPPGRAPDNVVIPVAPTSKTTVA